MLIQQGRVTVDGTCAKLGDRIDPGMMRVAIDGVMLPLDTGLVTWLVYKPPGVVATMDDPYGRPIVTDLVPPEPVTKPVGRLDVHSEGLMLLTNDGDLALRVTHPRFGIEKVYRILTTSAVSKQHLAAMVAGVDLDDGHARMMRARVVTTQGNRSMVEVVMTEGRKREIRRIFEVLGIGIERLVRTSIAGISDGSLAPGSYRALSVTEIRSIYEKASRQ
ncbi:MAG: pseudouridine synthase [Acidimicrobiia bacterium]